MSTPCRILPPVMRPRVPRRERLAALPTPLMTAPRLATALGVAALYVKRDDLTGFAVAGNKARPLEFLVAAARDERADMLLTGGTAGSNFCSATAAAAAWSGLACELVIAGCPPAGRAHPNLELARALGARLHWTGEAGRSSVDAEIPRLAGELRGEGRRVYAIPRGGATALGAVGYAMACWELYAQLAELGVQPCQVIVAVGSGGTLAGLLAGQAALTGTAGRHDGTPRITGASVSRPVAEAADRVLTLARHCARLLGAPAVQADDVHLLDARGPGHALPSEAGTRARELALRTEGLMLDPVYTAKSLAAVPAMPGDKQGPVVFWHTGGLMDAIAAVADQAGRRRKTGPGR